MRARATVIFTLTIGLASLASGAAPTYGGCAVFPADNYWNSRIDSLPVHPSSDAWVNAIGAGTQLHPDFSNNLADGFGFTPAVVPGSQQPVPIAVSDPSHSDAGPFPIPPSLATGSGSREVSVTESTNCILYEFFGAPVNGGARRTAGVAAKWTLGSNALRPDGWESGDHPGFPYLAGLM